MAPSTQPTRVINHRPLGRAGRCSAPATSPARRSRRSGSPGLLSESARRPVVASQRAASTAGTSFNLRRFSSLWRNSPRLSPMCTRPIVKRSRRRRLAQRRERPCRADRRAGRRPCAGSLHGACAGLRTYAASDPLCSLCRFTSDRQWSWPLRRSGARCEHLCCDDMLVSVCGDEYNRVALVKRTRDLAAGMG